MDGGEISRNAARRYPADVARLPQALQNAPVGQTRVSREELSERQLERILAAATEVFAKRGFQDSTVDNIVATAEVGVGSFYAHFDGKDECLDYVCRRIGAEAPAAIAAGLGDGGSWAERLCDGLHALLAFVAANPLAARVVLLEAQTGGPKVLGRYGAMIDEVVGLLRLGREASTLDRQWPPAFEEATAGGLVWLLQERLVRGELAEVDSLFGELAEVALEPYLGTTAARRQIKATLAASKQT
jgi:AcrR family transcriptional regulator